MFKKWCIRHEYTLIFLTFLTCFYGYSISRVYGFTFFPDEFGYWTYAAKAAGYDWSDIVSLGSYYSYGYSLILFPIFKLCSNAVTAYRVAVTLNFIMLAAVYFIMRSLAGRLCKTADSPKTTLYAAVAVLYPCWLFYARTTMVETFLMAVFALICLLLYDYLDKQRPASLLMLVVALAAIHFLHMRAVAILIAGIVTLLLYHFSIFVATLGQKEKKKTDANRKRYLLVALFVGLAVLIGGFLVKRWVQNTLYAGAQDTLAVNDYAGQLGKLQFMLTKEGITNFISGLAGKILYLGQASFGLAYWGIAHCIKKLQIKKWKTNTTGFFCLFVLLSVAGETLINTIYNIHPLRVDSVVYGRYHEFVLPILMVLGLDTLLHTAKRWRITGVMLAINLLMTLLVIRNVEYYGLTNIHGYVMAGMSYLHQLVSYETKQFFLMTYCFLSLLTVLVTGLAGRKGHKSGLMIIILVMELCLSIRAVSLYIEDSSLGAYRDSILAEKITELREGCPQRRIIYIKEDDSPFISILQFMLREEQIILLERKELGDYTQEEIDEDDMILLHYESDYGQQLEKEYALHIVNGHFQLYYNYVE